MKKPIMVILTLLVAVSMCGAASAQSFNNNTITGNTITTTIPILSPQSNAIIVNSGNSFNVNVNRNFGISRNIAIREQFSTSRFRDSDTHVSTHFRR